MLTKAHDKQPKGQTGACQQCFERESCLSFQLLCSVPLFYRSPISIQQYPAVGHQWFSALFVAPLLDQHSARGLTACQPPISHLVQFCSPRTLRESAAPLATAPPPEHATTILASGPAPHCASASVHAPISSSSMPTRLRSTSAQRAGWCGCADSDAAAPPTLPFLFLRQQTNKLHKAALPVWCFLGSMAQQSPTERTEI